MSLQRRVGSELGFFAKEGARASWLKSPRLTSSKKVLFQAPTKRSPPTRVNEKIHEIDEVLHSHPQDFLKVFGFTLDTVKVLIFPRDERMRALISLRAFGLQEIDAVRYYIAMLMAEHGLVSAPNMAIGEAFHIGAPVQATVALGGISRGPTGA